MFIQKVVLKYLFIVGFTKFTLITVSNLYLTHLSFIPVCHLKLTATTPFLCSFNISQRVIRRIKIPVYTFLYEGKTGISVFVPKVKCLNSNGTLFFPASNCICKTYLTSHYTTFQFINTFYPIK